LEPLVDLLEIAGFEVHAVSDLLSLTWGKLVVNTGINALSALLEVRNGELLESSHSRSLMNAAAMETARVAEALGIKLPYDDPSQEVEGVSKRTAENQSSMLQDIRRGAPTEVDAINGAVVREGELLGVPTPVNWTLWKLMRSKVGKGATPSGESG
jgi:2-dehydropantoate 2-reductase